GEKCNMLNNFAVVRQDTGDALGCVGNRFTPVQNVEAFQFVDDVCASKMARIEVAGALGRGEKVWVLARVNGEYRIGQTDDILEPYLFFSNGHDGKLALTCMFTSVRVVCQNTFNIAFSDKSTKKSEGKYFSIRHTQTIHGKAEEAVKVLNLSMERFQKYQEMATLLSYKQVNTEELRGYFLEVVPNNETAKKNTKTIGIRDDLESLFVQGEGNQLSGVRGSLWAAFNAVTQYVDHHKTVRNIGNNSRLESTQFGSGATMKDKAWDVAVSMLQTV
ncbi:MAG: DUF945 domain-containing protein, partial [Porphyromonadaceae bacterium]|nr:DUF945 domain-containing protein [Porphyromonadaceae bacterium]